MLLKELMFSLAIASLLEPKRETEFTRDRNRVFGEADREVDAYRARQRLLSQEQESYEMPITHYVIHIQEEACKKIILLASIEDGEAFLGTIYSDIKQAVNEVKRLKDDYLHRGFKVETQIDLFGEKQTKKGNRMLVCPNCQVGVAAKVWDAYTARVEGYDPEEMMGLSRGDLAKHREFDTQYRCPTCHAEIAGSVLLAE